MKAVETAQRVHPLIPNSEPRVREEMLETIGAADVDALYEGIPPHLRLDRRLELPPAIESELLLEREAASLLAANRDCRELLSFLGGGCWQHYVPALCDEIASRAEFLTAYWANAYTDHGKYQAFFEYASLLGELVGYEAVSLPTYDWGMAAGVAIRMGCRVAGRDEVVLAGTIGPERHAVIDNYCAPDLTVRVAAAAESGEVDLEALWSALSPRTGAVYFESPTFLGVIETQGPELARAAHEVGAQCVVGVDPISLGVLAPPSEYGADVVCGELQPLGVHMHWGGGLAGFIATRDEERYVREYPTFLIGLTPTSVAGEHGFGLVAWDRTSYIRREHGKDFGGTTTGLWAICAAVYLTLLGPAGIAELGEGILQRAHYAARELGRIPGVRAPLPGGAHFKEFVVGFDRSVAEVNAALLREGILGGHDVGRDIPGLGRSALYCVTELHTKADIDRLVAAVRGAVEA